MPIEDWIQRCTVARFLYDWQTLAAGILAVFAAVGTIRATIRSADREIAASQAQTAVAQKQIDTAAMERVLAEADEATAIFAAAHARLQSSMEAYRARRRFSKSVFSELRAACVSYGGHMTREFLDLESEIDGFASQTGSEQLFTSGQYELVGLHAGLQDQLDRIVVRATHLIEEAAAQMKEATTMIAETDPGPPTGTPTSEEVAGTPPKSS